jgi:hypothetical protein
MRLQQMAQVDYILFHRRGHLQSKLAIFEDLTSSLPSSTHERLGCEQLLVRVSKGLYSF